MAAAMFLERTRLSMSRSRLWKPPLSAKRTVGTYGIGGAGREDGRAGEGADERGTLRRVRGWRRGDETGRGCTCQINLLKTE